MNLACIHAPSGKTQIRSTQVLNSIKPKPLNEFQVQRLVSASCCPTLWLCLLPLLPPTFILPLFLQKVCISRVKLVLMSCWKGLEAILATGAMKTAILSTCTWLILCKILHDSHEIFVQLHEVLGECWWLSYSPVTQHCCDRASWKKGAMIRICLETAALSVTFHLFHHMAH